MAKTRRSWEANPIQCSLLNLTGDPINVVVLSENSPSETERSMGGLSSSCKNFYNFFHPELEKRAAKKLLKHILNGEESSALKMLTANVALFFIKTREMDYALGFDGLRRTIHGSPYQAILGAGDITLLNKIKPIIDRIENGRAIASTQFYEQFPNGIIDNSNTYDFKVLDDAIAKIPFFSRNYRARMNNELEKFWAAFKPVDVKWGLHFDLRILVKVQAICSQHYMGRNWDPRLTKLFTTKVFGYLQRLLPACDAQAFCQGLSLYIEQNQPLLRSIKTPDGKDFYPDPSQPDEGLGCYHAIPPDEQWLEQVAAESIILKLYMTKVVGLIEFKEYLQNPVCSNELGHNTGLTRT